MNTQNILKVVVVAGLLSMTCTTYATEGTWMKKADMPTARLGLTTSVVDGKIYAIGGGQDLYVGPITTVEEYDPATDTWTTKADMPGARYVHSATVVSGKIYVIGGSIAPSSAVATVQEYDPATDTWTSKADMPTKRAWLSTSVVDGKIYAIGGRIYPEKLNVSTVEEYDPATDTWTRKADMPTGRACLSTSVANGKIYAIGGGWLGALPTVVEEYDPVTDTWTKKADKPTAGKLVSTSVVNGKIYAIGGATGGLGPVSSAVEEYDPATDTWTKKANMPTARWFHSTSAVNGKIYAIGGDASGSRRSAISTVEEYTPQPVIDFNGDGAVDCADMCIMVDYWGTDEPLCDIGPVPWGDGIVDVQDLVVLAEHLFTYPGSVAYWALDETEGTIAYDSIGIYDSVLNGAPIWQPTGGAVDGALAFDGVDDYVSTPFVLNPADGAFSVFAWIKGGVRGQVIISQADRTIFGTTISAGSAWLSTDPAEGKLMTELQGLDQAGRPLASQTVVTDGKWHRIGLTWDCSNRILYVDDVEVARDTQPQFGSSREGLYIGAANNLEPGSFFSGLIDDVRIYNRAIIP